MNPTPIKGYVGSPKRCKVPNKALSNSMVPECEVGVSVTRMEHTLVSNVSG
jgi:hypothetical protein